jgi:hypothetical protein
MSKVGQLKKLWNYKPNVARCIDCTHYRESYVRLTENSQTKRTNRHCAKGGFTISQNGACIHWADRAINRRLGVGDASQANAGSITK